MGKGRLESRLKALVAELGIADSVIFLGQVSGGRRYFKAFDVFALSSDHEPVGMVLLEAMAAGLPIISCATGGAVEVVSGVGGLFPLRDETGLADRLREAARLTEPELAAVQQAMLERLAAHYADEAVRPHFFKLIHVFQ